MVLALECLAADRAHVLPLVAVGQPVLRQRGGVAERLAAYLPEKERPCVIHGGFRE